MKTSEVIRQLQKADPSGELECAVDGVDIHFIEGEPAFYDGAPAILIRDENTKFYNIIGAKFLHNGYKVAIHTHELEAAIAGNPEFPVESCCPRHDEEVEKMRIEWRAFATDWTTRND